MEDIAEAPATGAAENPAAPAAPAGGPAAPADPAGSESSGERKWKVTHITAEDHRTNRAWLGRSAYVPGFTKKGGSRICPKCNFQAFGWSDKCSKCGTPLQ